MFVLLWTQILPVVVFLGGGVWEVTEKLRKMRNPP